MAETYEERLQLGRYDIDNLDPDADRERFIQELAEILTPGGTYETLLVAAEMFRAGDISIPWETIADIQGRITQGLRIRLTWYANHLSFEDDTR